jgi:uncharacterized protein YndB with AHSA1/START domain
VIVRRERVVASAPEEVWELVDDPRRLPRWWPAVTRVEEVTPDAWTKVLTSPKGKLVRADYTRVESDPPRRQVWRHEAEESPFERILAESSVELELEPADGGTRVALSVHHSPRGWARLGRVQLRVAAGRQLDSALDGLERELGDEEAE